jgi:predicted membrane channel-forming protein YqfA (hemolysin III family)
MHGKRCSNFFSITSIIFVGLLYGLTANESAVTLEKTINWSSIIIGIVVGIAGIVLNIWIWLYTRENARKATLYFPLFLACRGIIEIIKDHEKLKYDRSKNLFASCARTLDEIVYKHGSIIHLKRVEDLSIFLSLKDAIDENIDFVEKESWADLKKKFKSDEFKEVGSYANTLLSRCKKEVKEVKDLS